MSTSYKDSLNLPQTDFPMKASLPVREPLLLEKWQQSGLYNQLRQSRKERPQYITHDGPPYANGHLHIGHVLNKTLKDIVTKSKSMSGFDAPLVPGWDCHGLPIELNVEKQFKSQGKHYTATEFRAACRAYATQQVNIQKEEFKRLGILADWDHPYLTMDFKTEADTIRALGECIKSGYIEHGLKPVHWCVACQSALAELEVNHQDKWSTAIDVKFKIVALPASLKTLPGHGTICIPIWTTTPWTLPANEAVAIGPHIEYCLIQKANERLLLAKNLYTACLARYGVTHDYTLLGTYLGNTFNALKLQHPFEDRLVPLIHSDHVSIDKGTGAVHIAPSHGPEDYLLGMQHQLPMRTLVDSKGRYLLEHNTELNQQSVLKADHLILNILSNSQTLLASEKIQHSYPHCWRHHLPIIFRATAQWFLRLKDQKLYQKFDHILQQVNWIPSWGEARMRKMLGETAETARPDWCLSRQRAWGVPLPFFIHKKTGQYHPKTLVWVESIAQRVEKEGIEAWYTLNPRDLLDEKDIEDYYPSTDVLDVWFDSGVTHRTILRRNPYLKWPADLYLEGSDQFRGWFQSSLITGAVLDEKAPYLNILTHGFTVDAKGQKMSKSMGNTLPLDTILKKWGADILRLWIAATDTRSEIVVSDETFQRTAEAYRRIRNTLRFLLGNVHDFNPEKDSIPSDKLLSFDRWLLARARTVQQTIQEAYEAFNFPLVYQTIHNFCIYELGSIYLSILKDRQYTMQKNSIGRRSGQTVLYHVAEAMLRWLAPILSFTSEEAWQYLPGDRTSSIFLTEWHHFSVEESTDPLSSFYSEAGGCERCWEEVIQIRTKVNQAVEAARNEGSIGSALEANIVIHLQADQWITRLLTLLHKELHFIFLTSQVVLKIDSPQVLSAKDIVVEVAPTDDIQLKCERCWHRCFDVGKEKEHPTLCKRCITNLPGAPGEQRYYA